MRDIVEIKSSQKKNENKYSFLHITDKIISKENIAKANIVIVSNVKSALFWNAIILISSPNNAYIVNIFTNTLNIILSNIF